MYILDSIPTWGAVLCSLARSIKSVFSSMEFLIKENNVKHGQLLRGIWTILFEILRDIYFRKEYWETSLFPFGQFWESLKAKRFQVFVCGENAAVTPQKYQGSSCLVLI